MSKQTPPDSASTPHEAGEHHGRPHAHEDELIVVPKGRSPLVFYLTLGVMLFVLFIFTVGDEVFRACSRGTNPAGETFMRWRHPTAGEQTLTQADFLQEKRQQHALMGLLAQGRRVDLDDDDTAEWIVMDALALDAGVAVTNGELQQWILRSFGDGATYKRILDSYQETPAEFEAALRRQLRIERYKALLLDAATAVDPQKLMERWRGRHQEYRFEYVELEADALKEDARADLPDDAALSAWYEALPADKKQGFVRPASASAELAWLPLEGEFDANALLSAYPKDIEDAAKHAQEYYDGFYYVRFKRETPDLSQGPSAAAFYKPFEAVEESALREAPLYDAISAWLVALRERESAGETIDLAAEAQKVGLSYAKQEEKLSLAQWTELEQPWAGNYVGRSVVEGVVGSLGKAPIVDEQAFVVVRTLEKEDERTPDFAEIRDEVAELWLADHAAELARQRLEALRDGFGERPSDGSAFRPEVGSERFREVAEGAGYQVVERAWAERSPARQPEEPTPADLYFRASQTLYTLPEGTVGEAELSRDRSRAFLVRVAGVRDPEQVAINPGEIATLRGEAERDARTSFLARTFDSPDYLRERYDLWLRSWEKEAGS